MINDCNESVMSNSSPVASVRRSRRPSLVPLVSVLTPPWAEKSKVPDEVSSPDSPSKLDKTAILPNISEDDDVNIVSEVVISEASFGGKNQLSIVDEIPEEENKKEMRRDKIAKMRMFKQTDN